ncbi:Pentatricopeptide repeat [Thalictrum thalictroides]|uniref:Pentatricopeptide repeat n=1 Tax=Thalictrum thalictroides TaxID=46969 RepID=A0A7J6XHG3_THATH|nr:Pentatricopeptide repeat [Thalictrum thalictroides]
MKFENYFNGCLFRSREYNTKHDREIFDSTSLNVRDTVSYNAMITGYSHNNDGHHAVKLFGDMLRGQFRPDHFTFSSVLSALALVVEDERQCGQLHSAVVKSGAGYVRNDDDDSARQLFDSMTDKLQVAWSAMISGYVQCGRVLEALYMFKRMCLEGIKLDEFTYTSVLGACANYGYPQHGKELHGYILHTETKSMSHLALSVNNALVSLYSKCGEIDRARHIFDIMLERDLVLWNAILCGSVNAGRIGDAKRVYDVMPEKNYMSWTVMISGFTHSGLGEEALQLFNRLRIEGHEPCDYMFAGAILACVIIACAGLGALEHGRQLHAQLVRFGLDSSLSAGNALVTMYAKCGVVEAAHHMFLTMPYVDSSWNAMIAALGQHGHGAEALELFNKMLQEAILPDRITFLTILSACGHAGLVNEGCQYFYSMKQTYGIDPGEDHYACFIDLLCRAGKISEAKHVIETMPFEPGAPVCGALLAGCRVHGNMELGIQAADRLFHLVPQQDGTYVMLANIYASAGRWDDMAKVRKLMRDRGVKKEPGCSWIEVANKVHVFLVGDTKHPDVYKYLEEVGLCARH